jgi:hypothetical protein
MGQRLIISESEKNRIKGLYENNMDVKDGGSSKRPFDKMVIDCLKAAGFVVNDTGGKYEFSMYKSSLGQDGKQKVGYLIRSSGDPTLFDIYMLLDGKLLQSGELKIGTTTNCKTIVDSAHLLINNVKRNYSRVKPIY